MTAIAPTAEAVSRARKATIAGALGTIPEWFDYGIYGTAAALFIGPLFFSGADRVTGTLSAFAVFAVGYIARPLGGIVLGHYGDRKGRRAMLLLTISMMAAATFLIGCLPTNAQIGAWAPLFLVILRLIQGFGAGAELAGAITYANESVTQHNKGFLTAIVGGCAVVGLLLGTVFYAVLNGIFSNEQMLAWGWRIPFLFSAVVAIVPLVMRSKLIESEAFLEHAHDKLERAVDRFPILDLLRQRKLATFAGILSQIVLAFSSYVILTFVLSYLINTVGLPSQVGLVSTLVGQVIGLLSALLFGLLTDRIGGVRVLIMSGVGSAIFAWPFFVLLNTANPILITVAVAIGYSLTFGMTVGAQGVFLPGLFDTRSRLTGVAMSREFSNAFIGGTAPLVAGALVAVLNGAPWLLVGAMVLAGVLTTLGAVIAIPLLRRRGALDVLRGSRNASALDQDGVAVPEETA